MIKKEIEKLLNYDIYYKYEILNNEINLSNFLLTENDIKMIFEIYIINLNENEIKRLIKKYDIYI